MEKKKACFVVLACFALACLTSAAFAQGNISQRVENTIGNANVKPSSTYTAAPAPRSGNTDPANSVHAIQDVGKFIAPPTHASVPSDHSLSGLNETTSEQINPNYFYSNEPAPMGITDYGINPNTNTFYTYATTSFMGSAEINSLVTSGGAYSGWAGIQLNVVLKFQARSATYYYWLQDVGQINENSGYPGYPNLFYFLDNIWNMSSNTASISLSGLSGSGTTGTYGSTTYYYCEAPSYDDWYISYPNPMQLEINSTEINFQPVVSFSFNIGNGWVTYDKVTFTPGSGPLQDWNLVVDGSNYVPHNYNMADAEFVLCGEGNSATTTDTSSNIDFTLSYYNGNNMQFIPFQYDFGSDTAETISNVHDVLSEYPSGGAFYAVLTQGSGTLGHFTGVPATGRFSIPDANGGTFYIGNSPESGVTFTGQSAQVTIYPGTYTVSIGNWENSYTFSSGNNPVITLPDVPGAPLSLSASSAVGGPVTLTWSAPASNGGLTIGSYNINRGTSEGEESYLCTVYSTSYVDNSTNPGMIYYYTVAADNDVGEGSQSDETSVLVPTLLPPPIEIDSPSDGANWSATIFEGGYAQSYYIEWTELSGSSYAEIGPYVEIELNGISNDSHCSVISIAPNTGNYSWTIPSLANDSSAGVPSGYYYISIDDLSANTIAISNTLYIFDPYTTITNPTSSSNVTAGTSCSIDWSSYSCSSDVDIGLVYGNESIYDGFGATIASQVVNNGQFSWIVPSGLFGVPSGYYRICISDYGQIYGYSDEFYISNYYVLTTYMQSWNFEDQSLSDWTLYGYPSTSTPAISDAVAHSGSYSVCLNGTDGGTSELYRSDYPLVINSFSSWVYVTSFSTNATMVIFSSQNYQFVASVCFMEDGQIALFNFTTHSSYANLGAYSLNTWYHIGLVDDHNGLCAIYVNGVLKTTALYTSGVVADSFGFLVSGGNTGNNMAFVDDVQVNDAPSVTVPSGSVSWAIGSFNNIEWDSSGFGSYVNIFLSNSSGSWAIAAGVSNTGYYSWEIPLSQAAGMYKIKIVDVTYSGVCALSGTFTITTPSITQPANVKYDVGTTGHSISWTITSASTGATSYTIYRNGTSLASSSWFSGTPIAWNVDYLQVGSYNCTISASDGLGGTVNSTVVVTVFTPSITHQPDVFYKYNTTGHSISWIITDKSVATTSYIIYQNGTQVANGSWVIGTPVSINVDGLSISSYNYTIVATDGLGGSVQDTVCVMVQAPSYQPTPAPTSTNTGTIVAIALSLIGGGIAAIIVALLMIRKRNQVSKIKQRKGPLI